MALIFSSRCGREEEAEGRARRSHAFPSFAFLSPLTRHTINAILFFRHSLVNTICLKHFQFSPSPSLSLSPSRATHRFSRDCSERSLGRRSHFVLTELAAGVDEKR